MNRNVWHESLSLDLAPILEVAANLEALAAKMRATLPAPTAPRETAPPVGNPAAGPRDDDTREAVVAGGWVSALSSSARSTYINAKIIAANPIAAVDLGSVTVGSHEATVRVSLLEELARRTVLLAQEAGEARQALAEARARIAALEADDELDKRVSR